MFLANIPLQLGLGLIKGVTGAVSTVTGDAISAVRGITGFNTQVIDLKMPHDIYINPKANKFFMDTVR